MIYCRGQKNKYKVGRDLKKNKDTKHGRMYLTNSLMMKVGKVVGKMCQDYNDRADCVQEALIAILEAKEGQTESWYISRARFRAQEWLRKERQYRFRNVLLEVLGEDNDIV